MQQHHSRQKDTTVHTPKYLVQQMLMRHHIPAHSFSRHYIVSITTPQPRPIYQHRKNILQKMRYILILMHQNSLGHQIVCLHITSFDTCKTEARAKDTTLFKAAYPLYLTIIFLFFSVQCLFHLPCTVLTSFIKSISTEKDLLPFLHEDNCIGFL
jgi:hypothetical protein